MMDGKGLKGGIMGQKRRRKRRKKHILLWLSVIFLGSSTGVLALRLPQQFKAYRQSQEVLAEAYAEKEKGEAELTTAKTSVVALEKEIEALEAELQQLQKENPTMHQALQNGKTRYAYLTFDDGPSENTIKILDFLKANNIKATFFVVGVDGNDAIYKRIVDEGHTLAVHSETHRYQDIYRSVDAFMADLEALQSRLYAITGVRSKVLRFPGGSNNTISEKYNRHDIMDQLIEEVEAQGYHYFDWNVDSLDATAVCPDKDIIVQGVLDGAKDKKNAIILMHDTKVKKTTVEALPEIVTGLRAQGYVFDKMTEDTVAVQFR